MFMPFHSFTKTNQRVYGASETYIVKPELFEYSECHSEKILLEEASPNKNVLPNYDC